MLKLTEAGASCYRIVISAQAGAPVRYAAAELAKYLEKISGVALPIVEDTAPAQAKEIVLGKADREGVPCAAALKNDGYLWKTVGEKLFLLSNTERGCIYAVYRLLEKYLGCGFYAEGVEKVPAAPTVELPELDESLCPPFEYRRTSWNAVSAAPNAEFSAKRGFNTFKGSHTEPILAHSLCHTLFSLLSPEDYFDEHPEYFSMVNGIRIREQTQLCLTNPEVLEIAKKSLRRIILEHPECKIFSVSQMDWYNPCECPECARIDAEEGSHMGTMLRFVNACADSVAEEFPDVIIETLAYQYTRKPPKITKARPNVCVCICSIECCFTHPLRDCRHISVPFRNLTDPDLSFQADLEGWSSVCSRMMVWDYTTNFRFYLAPMINLHVLQDNMKYFIENNVTLMFEQGNGQSVSGEFGELRAYLISKLMWEPDGDVSAWMDEFLAGYYGEGAAKPIREYIDYLVDHVTRHHVHAGIYENPMDVIPNTMIPKMDALWDAAEAAATGDDLARVRRSRLQVKFVKQHRRRVVDADMEEEAEKLIDEITANGITYIQESHKLEESFAQMRTGYLPDAWQTFWRPQPGEKK